MNKYAKISSFMNKTQQSRAVAIAYLEAEEGDLGEALTSWRGDTLHAAVAEMSIAYAVAFLARQDLGCEVEYELLDPHQIPRSWLDRAERILRKRAKQTV